MVKGMHNAFAHRKKYMYRWCRRVFHTHKENYIIGLGKRSVRAKKKSVFLDVVLFNFIEDLK